jgi:hypothetical protein
VKYPGGKRKKGQHKSKASIAAGKKNAAKAKKAPRPNETRNRLAKSVPARYSVKSVSTR